MSGVEQCSGAVVDPVRDSERDSLDELHQVVRGFGGPVREPGPMSWRDLIPPTVDRSPEPLHLGRTGTFLEIDAKLSHEGDSEVGIAGLVIASDDLLRMPGHADLPSRVAHFEQSAQLRVGLVIETFVCDRHQLGDPIGRTGLAAPMA